MPEVRNVTGTAFVVAEFRATENHEPAPLYHDPIVGMFLDADSRRAADRIEAIFPQSRDLVRLRTKYFDDHLDACAVAQFRQVVILGAGLDTRAVRKGGSALRFFEIDDVATLELKRSAYRRRAVHVDAIFIPGNYLTDGLVPLLAASGFDFELPTCFIWEGNTMYHAMEDVADLLATVRDRVRRFRIAFDYLSDAVIDKTTGDAGVTRLVEGFEAMGAPWRSGIRDLPAFARELKLRVVNDLRTADLYRRYWQGRPMTSPIFDFYSVCTLEPLPAVDRR